MGIEAIHFGQMYRIGAKDTDTFGDVSVVDLAAWQKVLDMITEYAKTNARRGYVIYNGHNEDIRLTRTDNTNQMLLDYTMYPMRLEAVGSNHPASNGFQDVKLTQKGNAPYVNEITDVVTRTGEDCSYFPYVLEIDNFGYDASNLDKVNSSGDYVWGYDEISWYANQQRDYRHAFLTNIATTIMNNSGAIANFTGTPNGHIAMPGKRTAYISKTGASEYRDLDWTIANRNSDGITQHPLWDIAFAGDIDAIIDAWEKSGCYEVDNNWVEVEDNSASN
jgi:hypothetical protein